MAIILIGVAYAVFCMVKYSKPGYIETETYQTRLGFVVYNEARRCVPHAHQRCEERHRPREDHHPRKRAERQR